jgi:hypothetical protein
MLRHLVRLALVLPLLDLLTAPVRAQQPENILPPPMIVPPGAAGQPALLPHGYYPGIVPPHMPRPGTREVWQYMGVTDTGRYRPRVILSPYGSYNYYNREPYPWVNNRSTNWMPYAVD